MNYLIKNILVGLSLSLVVFPSVNANLAVFDGAAQAERQAKRVEDAANWAESIGRLNDQLDEAKKYVELTGKMKDALGDPTQIAGLIDSELLGGELGNAGIGELLSEASDLASGAQDLSDNSKELFSPIDFRNPLDASGFDSHDPYKKFEAFRSTFANFEKVSKDVQGRRNTLKQEASRLQTQLKTASTDAEVQKLQGQIQVNNAALAALDQEQKQATDQVVAQAAANDQDKDLASKQEADAINAEEAETISNISFENSTPKAFIPVSGLRP